MRGPSKAKQAEMKKKYVGRLAKYRSRSERLLTVTDVTYDSLGQTWWCTYHLTDTNEIVTATLGVFKSYVWFLT
jgi:hypothetical protein